MRIFRNCLDMVQEIDRELAVCGQTVRVKHYQDKQLDGDDQITKELVGVNFTISNPRLKKTEMLEFLYKNDAERILNYCHAEHADRTSGIPMNPGESYKIREDLWNSFRNRNGKFDYTYSERIFVETNQVENVIATLKEDPNSRRAMVMIFGAYDTEFSEGSMSRIPCSISYQFLIRNNALQIIYYIRSNDYFKHFGIDIWLAQEMQEHIYNNLLSTYPRLKIGPLHYMCGSLHAYNEDLSKWVIY